MDMFDDDDDTIKRMSANRDLQIAWQVGFDTHIGARKSWISQTNQDCFFFDRYENSAILLVADGISISSAGSGDVASNITAQTVAHFGANVKKHLSIRVYKKSESFVANIDPCQSRNLSYCTRIRRRYYIRNSNGNYGLVGLLPWK